MNIFKRLRRAFSGRRPAPCSARRGLSEGMVKKGGVNDAPTTPKPSFHPKGQGGRRQTNEVHVYVHHVPNSCGEVRP